MSSNDSLSKIRRAQAQLQKLVDGKVLSPSGHDFLVAAIDPMHDLQLRNLQGWPDLETAPSVVRCVKQSLTIKAPSGITDNWDCLIHNWQHLASRPSVSCARDNQVVSYPVGGSFPLGGVQAYYNASGVPINLTSGTVGQIVLPSSYEDGVSRIVGMGIEVINSTAEIYKQGQVTVFRIPQPDRDPQGYIIGNTGSGVSTQSLPVSVENPPPTTQAVAMLACGSRQWRASEGCYMVVPFVGEENPPLGMEYVQPCVETFEVPAAGSTTSVMLPYHQGANTINPALLKFGPAKIYPLHMAGAFFTGLSPQTTLTITANMYVETFPRPTDELAPLATPSAEFDPEALKIFSHAMGSLPVGVPADMNGFGDWFAGVVSQIGDWIAAPLSALPHPLAKAAGAAALGAKGLADNYLASQSPQSRPKVQAATAPKRKRPAKKKKPAQQQPAKKK